MVLTFAPVRGVCGRPGRRTARRWGGPNRTTRRPRLGRRRCRECAARGGGSGLHRYGCGGATGRWSRRGCSSESARRGSQIQRGLRGGGLRPGWCGRVSSGRGRGRRSGAGSRLAGFPWRPVTWTGRRWRGCGPQRWVSPTFRQRGTRTASTAAALPAVSAAQPPATAAQENLFWQSIMNSTNPADFEAYLEQFPNGVFRRLAENRLTALREQPAGTPSGGAPRVGSPTSAAADARLPTPRLAIDFGDDTGEFRAGWRMRRSSFRGRRHGPSRGQLESPGA